MFGYEVLQQYEWIRMLYTNSRVKAVMKYIVWTVLDIHHYDVAFILMMMYTNDDTNKPYDVALTWYCMMQANCDDMMMNMLMKPTPWWYTVWWWVMNALMQSFEAADSWQVFFVQYTSIATLLRMMMISDKTWHVDVNKEQVYWWAGWPAEWWAVSSRILAELMCVEQSWYAAMMITSRDE